ncbi:MAG: hypothetical protein QOE65_1146 [Solirubrobacteraceae bacterium]|jgi:hypothetical protein|nr:hypothetical protein [Solirubrobacteraceae bacterium]
MLGTKNETAHAAHHVRRGALAGVVALLVAAAAAQATPLTQLTSSLTTARSGRSVFAIRGTETSFGIFSITARLSQVPCGGRMRFRASGSNLSDGSSSVYVSDVAVSAPHEVGRAVRCGRPLPGWAGADGGSVALHGISPSNAGRRVVVEARRQPDGSYTGRLHVLAVLCAGSYELVAKFKNRGSTSTVRYRFQMLNPKLNGAELPRC